MSKSVMEVLLYEILNSKPLHVYFLAGDPLTLVVSIDNQNIYGMHISECMVKDGLGWSEQRLINGEG